MNIKKIDFTLISAAVGDTAEILFVNPCKIWRVYPIHEVYEELGTAAAIRDILDRTCSFKSKDWGIWFFLPDEQSDIEAALQYLYELNIPAWKCEPVPDYGHDQEDKPIKEKLN